MRLKQFTVRKNERKFSSEFLYTRTPSFIVHSLSSKVLRQRELLKADYTEGYGGTALLSYVSINTKLVRRWSDRHKSLRHKI